MKLSFLRPVGAFATMIIFTACSGSSVPRASDNTPSNIAAVKNSKTFRYTGSEQKFVVPKGVTQLTVLALGGEGAGSSPYLGSGAPGSPGRVKAIIPVHPRDKLYIFVGGSGLDGGFNGGGAGGTSGSGSYAGNPGGGASDVRIGGAGLKDAVPGRAAVQN
jgi:hypothetical protein